MTDPTSPLTDDELSDLLDDPTNAALADRAAADPGAQARLTELEAARAAVGEPVPPLADATVDDLIANALDAGTDEAEGPGAVIAPPTPIRPRRIPAWTVAAAIVLLLGTGLALVFHGSQSTSSSATFSKVGSSIAESSSGHGSSNRDKSGLAAGGSNATASSSAGALDAAKVIDLGSFVDAAAFRTALRTQFPEANFDSTYGASAKLDAQDRSSASLKRCAQTVQTVLRLTTAPTHRGIARINGQPALVYEFSGPSFKTGEPTTIVAAVGPTACDPLVTFER